MIYTIKNEALEIQISSRGAELQSIKNKDGIEYLWQGDKKYWSGRATNIFPYVGRMTEGTCTYRGREYQMEIHGFVKKTELEARQQNETTLSFTTASNQNTELCYPFSFQYEVTYELTGNRLNIIYTVQNTDQKTIHFGIGGHPGFQVPVAAEGSFEDWYLEFKEPGHPSQVTLSPDYFISGKTTPFPLAEGKYLPLTHSLFDRDAIILQEMSKTVTLKSDKSTRAVTLEYPDMTYLGIWHTPKTTANFICLEPWTSLPSRSGRIEDLEHQENLIALPQGQTYQNHWGIEIR